MRSPQRSPLRGVSVLPFGVGLAGGFAVLASPEVRALAAEWVASSRAYFAAFEAWARVRADSDDRPAIEAAVDAAVRADEDVRRRIIAMRSVEPGAMALKVAAAQVHMRAQGGVDAVLDEWSRHAGPQEEAFALALVRDMADALGPSIQVLADAARPERRT